MDGFWLARIDVAIPLVIGEGAMAAKRWRLDQSSSWTWRYVVEFIQVLFFFIVCLESHEQFFSSLATVTITGDGAANLDLCLALTTFSSERSFTCHTHCDTGPLFLRSYPKDPWFYLLNAVLLAKEQSLPILNVIGLTRPVRARLELTTYRLLIESTTTRLRQPVSITSDGLGCFNVFHN
jgi:hypothetical protein